MVSPGRSSHAEHIKEFGSGKFAEVVTEAHDESFAESRYTRLRKRVVRPRHIQQHIIGDTLYRTAGRRSVSKDELFLDLIIVACIAAIGHELRDSFAGWEELEKFLLLFGAVYSSWHAQVLYWNMWGVTGDLLDKAIVYLIFTLLTAIGIGAGAAFTVARPYVGTAAFLATAIPLIITALFATREPLLNHAANIVNQTLFASFFQILATVPYLVAAFVPSTRTARILFWIPPVAQPVVLWFSVQLFALMHRKREGHSKVAVNIELFAEKHEVLTLIVLGESLLAILFEAESTHHPYFFAFRTI